jgi:hypothetical protein
MRQDCTYVNGEEGLILRKGVGMIRKEENERAPMNGGGASRNPFGETDLNDLADIRDIVIDTSLPPEERKKSYLRQIKNPCLYRCGDVTVSISFADGGATLADRLKQYLLSGRGMRL